MSKVDDFGNPDAAYCRHCSAKRVQHGGVLICRNCDAPLHLLAIKSHDCPHTPRCPRSAAA